MNQIKTNSIGNQYTAGAINRQTIAQSQVRVVNPSTGGSMGTVSSTQALSAGALAPRRNAATFNSFGGGGTSAKPFSTASRGPTVSPYLNLFQEGLSDDFDTYNTLVRPQLRQQQFNQTLQLETQAIDRKVRSYAAQPAFNPQGSQQQSPTGHPTGFMYYSHFYPGMQQQRGR
ncbi:hypothetical protein [Posidoniimonas corsicana]|uniref:hypothetical protein n=1 Tax=Posidoniimonas corsicana TaxID=1938618 RepID=UPI0011B4F528|nr:hypothetical protein [Posidoniimonas corsicana]